MLFGSDPVAPLQKGERNVKTRFVSETIYYESQPVGLAEVIDASEASLGGLSGKNGCKQGQVDGDNGFWSCAFSRVMYQVAIGWRWGSTPLVLQFWGVRGDA